MDSTSLPNLSMGEPTADPSARGDTYASARGMKARSPATALRDAPRLDGELLTGLPARTQGTSDVGNIVRRAPAAVLKPGSAEDVARMMRLCREHRLKIAARGQGHTTFGQSQVQDGVLVDMSALGAIHRIESDRVVVNAGATWGSVLRATAARGLAPPVLTGFLGLSVGGTLSVGGVGAMSHRHSAQVDHVLELDVVTGKGELETCSPDHRRELFEGALAGLGQCGIIVRATLRLVTAPARVRSYALRYESHESAAFFSDLRELARREELDMVSGSMSCSERGRWTYGINATSCFTPPREPEPHLLERLRRGAVEVPSFDARYVDYLERFDVLVRNIDALDLWSGMVRPWFHVFLPDTSVERFVGAALRSMGEKDVGMRGFVTLCPVKRSRSPRPLLRMPDEERVFLFHILTTSDSRGPSPAFAAQMLVRNRRLFEAARHAGGALYPIAAVPMQRSDWVEHYGAAWSDFASRKRAYDPDAILTPGPGIF
jgi:cytokinin dehydrogenase